MIVLNPCLESLGKNAGNLSAAPRRVHNELDFVISSISKELDPAIRQLLPEKGNHIMPVDSTRAPTEEEARWRQVAQERERWLTLGFLGGGIPMSIEHEDWNLRDKKNRETVEQESFGQSEKKRSTSSSNDRNHKATEESGESSSTILGNKPPAEHTQAMCLHKSQPYQSLPTQVNINMHSPKKDDWFGARAIVDNGTAENWISKDKVDCWELKTSGGAPVQCLTFNGGVFETDRMAEVTWCPQGAKKTERVYFHVIEHPPFDVLFGRNIVQAAPRLFFSPPDDPTLILVQTKVEKSEKKEIERNREAHRAKSKAIAAKAHGAKREPGNRVAEAKPGGTGTHEGRRK